MTSINTDQIGNFLKATIRTDKLSLDDAKDLGVKIKDFNAADSDHDGVLTADEIADCDDMAKFISGLIEEQKEIENEKSEESKNKEEEKVNKKDDTKN